MDVMDGWLVPPERALLRRDDIYAGIDGLCIRVERASAAFMAVEVDRKVYCILQCGNQGIKKLPV